MTYPDSNDYLSNVTDDYRPPHVRHAERVSQLMRTVAPTEPPPYEPIVAKPDRLQEIAYLVRSLTWCEMMEYADGTKGAAEEIIRWANNMP